VMAYGSTRKFWRHSPRPTEGEWSDMLHESLTQGHSGAAEEGHEPGYVAEDDLDKGHCDQNAKSHIIRCATCR
jgi:hypothetical protein